MATYGEIKNNLDEFSAGHLMFMQEECLSNIREGIKVEAESDLLSAINNELARREDFGD